MPEEKKPKQNQKPETQDQSPNESLSEGTEFENEALVKDFMSAVNSSKLVNHLSETKPFLAKVLELVKQEPQFLKSKINLFEGHKPMKPSQVYYSESDLLRNLFGGS